MADAIAMVERRGLDVGGGSASGGVGVMGMLIWVLGVGRVEDVGATASWVWCCAGRRELTVCGCAGMFVSGGGDGGREGSSAWLMGDGSLDEMVWMLIGPLGFGGCVWASWLASSSAVTNARTEPKRSSDFLASAVRMTFSTAGGSDGKCGMSGAGGVTLCLTAISVKEPRNGHSPLSHS